MTCTAVGCTRPVQAHSLCSTHYWHHWRDKTLPPRLTPLERFERYVDRSAGPDGCHLWTGGMDGRGYGQFYAAGGHVKAYRFAYEAVHGQVPSGLVLDHLCHTPACVNVRHLEAVTQAENVRRGRNAPASRPACPQGHPYDETNTRIRSTGARQCRACGRIAARHVNARLRASAEYARRLSHATPARRGLSVDERFWRHVHKDEPDGCWVWFAACDDHGYGRFGVTVGGAKRVVKAHRFAYEREHGAVPPGFDLDHLCRNPQCVRPSHLEPVTRSENIRRGIAAKRAERAAA